MFALLAQRQAGRVFCLRECAQIEDRCLLLLVGIEPWSCRLSLLMMAPRSVSISSWQDLKRSLQMGHFCWWCEPLRRCCDAFSRFKTFFIVGEILDWMWISGVWRSDQCFPLYTAGRSWIPIPWEHWDLGSLAPNADESLRVMRSNSVRVRGTKHILVRGGDVPQRGH